MFRRFTAFLPATLPRWEVWSCPASASATLRETTKDTTLPDKSAGNIIIALPARQCRTLAMRIPSQDSKTVRMLAYAQLEKRGLAAATVEQTAFECYTIPQPEGGAILSVDVIAPGATAPWASLKPAALLAAARCYSIPPGVLILAEEQGTLVLWLARDGVLIHSHIVSASRQQLDQLAVEIRITALTLQQQKLTPEISRVECWSHFTDAENTALSAALGMPVLLGTRPDPDPILIHKFSTSRLLPSTGRAALRGRQLRSWKWVAASVMAGLALFWWMSQHQSLAALEDKARGLQAAIDAAAGSNPEEKALTQKVLATQAQWQGLIMALEPRRYPLIQLNGVTRCLGAGSVVLSRFECKGPETAVAGTAQSAGEAYTYYSTIIADPALRLYEWSMVQPVIAANGSASFQIKGKMR